MKKVTVAETRARENHKPYKGETQSTQPIAADLMVQHDYRDIKIGENTTVTIDLEEIKKKMVEDIYKAIGCPFMEG